MIKKNKKDSEMIEETFNTIDDMDPEEDDISSPEFPTFVTTNPWVLIIAVASYKKTADAIALLKNKGFNYPNQYIDVSGNENYSIVLDGFQKQQDAIKHRKRIVAMTGLRAIVMESKKFINF